MKNINLIIFDLDGVLVKAKEIHFEALNEALGSKYKISWEEHLSKYDGLKTKQKLEMLSKEKNLPKEFHNKIWDDKQKYTIKKLNDLSPNQSLISCIKSLSDQGYKIACCSNSIRKTILMVLHKLNIIEYFDIILSNEDVKNSKPHPEIYWKCISEIGTLPENTLIVEDSPHGLMAAYKSKANVLRVSSPDDVTIELIESKIDELNKKKDLNMPKWSNKKMNVLIPMAGAGSRFEKAGYSFPKPLIDVNGKPMIQVVVENLNIDANYIFIVQKIHREKYNLDALLNLISPKCSIIEVDGLTEGAACTALKAKNLINNDDPLFFANSDQFVEWDSNEFMYKMLERNVDGGIVTFNSTHPKWSFAKIDDCGFVTEVAEKNPISDLATVGYYYWKHGKDFVNYAEEMIRKNIRVNNEFYVCPVFNQAVSDNKKIITSNADKMWGIGTPEDLKYFIDNYHKQ
jgi:HAD superfamily hydrolase (TIGR01509 family)